MTADDANDPVSDVESHFEEEHKSNDDDNNNNNNKNRALGWGKVAAIGILFIVFIVVACVMTAAMVEKKYNASNSGETSSLTTPGQQVAPETMTATTTTTAAAPPPPTPTEVGVDSDSTNNTDNNNAAVVDVSKEDPLGSAATPQKEVEEVEVEEQPKDDEWEEEGEEEGDSSSTPSTATATTETTTTEDESTATSSESSATESTATTTGGDDESAGPRESSTSTSSTSTTGPSPTCSALSFAKAEDGGSGNGTWVQIADGIEGEDEFDLSGFTLDMNADGSIVAVASTQNRGKTGDGSGQVRVFRYGWEVQEDRGTFSQLGPDIDGEAALDWFGSAVSLDAAGHRIAVGGRWNDGENGQDSGHVRVFDYRADEDRWVQVGTDIDGLAAGDQLGRDVSLSADGRRLAVGASNADGSSGGGENDSLTDIGSVYLYDFIEESSAWGPIGKIDGDEQFDLSGKAISLSGDGSRVAIGAYLHDGGTTTSNVDVGQVRVFQFDAAAVSWSKVGQDIEGISPGDWAGAVVSLNEDGSRVAVGISGDNNNFLPGVTRVFELQQDDEGNNHWFPMGDADLQGGYSVSLTPDGSRVVVGDYKGFANGINSGHTLIYDFDEETNRWTVVGQEIDGTAQEMSGTAVAVSADGLRVAISAPAHTSSSGKQQIGATRVYELC